MCRLQSGDREVDKVVNVNAAFHSQIDLLENLADLVQVEFILGGLDTSLELMHRCSLFHRQLYQFRGDVLKFDIFLLENSIELHLVGYFSHLSRPS